MESFMAKVSIRYFFKFFNWRLKETVVTLLVCLHCERRKKAPKETPFFVRSISEVHVCMCVRVQSLKAEMPRSVKIKV